MLHICQWVCQNYGVRIHFSGHMLKSLGLILPLILFLALFYFICFCDCASLFVLCGSEPTMSSSSFSVEVWPSAGVASFLHSSMKPVSDCFGCGAYTSDLPSLTALSKSSSWSSTKPSSRFITRFIVLGSWTVLWLMPLGTAFCRNCFYGGACVSFSSSMFKT